MDFCGGWVYLTIPRLACRCQKAAAMDPQQQAVLVFGYAAFLSSGIERHALMQSLAGVYIGITTLDFNELLHSSPVGGTVYAATGLQSLNSIRATLVFARHARTRHDY